jgi:hypothetical protein
VRIWYNDGERQEVTMYAISGVYDGSTVRFDDPVPVKEKYNVLITFLAPLSLNE